MLFFLTLAAVLTVMSVPVFAAETTPSTGVSITIVMPDTTDRSPQGDATIVPTPSAPTAPALYPVSVEELRENGGRQIVKTYALSAGENPANISREAFDRDDWRYALTDITKAETAVADAREHTETVTVNTDSNDMDAILRRLAPTLEFTSEDGYTGVLTLNIASIKVEQAGTKTSSFNVSAVREYPHLSANDTSLIPKTITDGGRTLQLAGVDWRAGNTVTVDYEVLPEYYTAVATYTGAGSKTVVTGYVTTAEYTGTVSKLSRSNTIYTAYFSGTEIAPERTPIEIVTPTPEPSASPDQAPDAPANTGSAQSIVIAALCVLLIGLGAGYILTRRKRAVVSRNNEGDTTP
jgi:LPXTG-motif cell wall-anchored protein